MIVAAAMVATVARSTGRRSPKAVVEAYALRNEASRFFRFAPGSHIGGAVHTWRR